MTHPLRKAPSAQQLIVVNPPWSAVLADPIAAIDAVDHARLPFVLGVELLACGFPRFHVRAIAPPFLRRDAHETTHADDDDYGNSRIEDFHGGPALLKLSSAKSRSFAISGEFSQCWSPLF